MHNDEDKMSPVTKTKQERIRDNQRRSRARRQEYLADLERRLSECHITCREADLQKQAFGQLQLENTRLRELLAYAGISLDLVESYVAQDSFPPTDANPSLRQIKPKMYSADASKASRRDITCSTTPSPHSPPALTTTYPSTPLDSVASPTYHPMYSPGSMPISHSPHSMSYPHSPLSISTPGVEWPFYETHVPVQPHGEYNYANEPMQLVMNDPHAPAFHNAALYSVAKEMIGRHHVKAEEIEDIKRQLYPSVTQAAYPGPNCSVDGQILFNVLNELSARQG